MSGESTTPRLTDLEIRFLGDMRQLEEVLAGAETRGKAIAEQIGQAFKQALGEDLLKAIPTLERAFQQVNQSVAGAAQNTMANMMQQAQQTVERSASSIVKRAREAASMAENKAYGETLSNQKATLAKLQTFYQEIEKQVAVLQAKGKRTAGEDQILGQLVGHLGTTRKKIEGELTKIGQTFDDRLNSIFSKAGDSGAKAMARAVERAGGNLTDLEKRIAHTQGVIDSLTGKLGSMGRPNKAGEAITTGPVVDTIKARIAAEKEALSELKTQFEQTTKLGQISSVLANFDQQMKRALGAGEKAQIIEQTTRTLVALEEQLAKGSREAAALAAGLNKVAAAEAGLAGAVAKDAQSRAAKQAAANAAKFEAEQKQLAQQQTATARANLERQVAQITTAVGKSGLAGLDIFQKKDQLAGAYNALAQLRQGLVDNSTEAVKVDKILMNLGARFQETAKQAQALQEKESAALQAALQKMETAERFDPLAKIRGSAYAAIHSGSLTNAQQAVDDAAKRRLEEEKLQRALAGMDQRTYNQPLAKLREDTLAGIHSGSLDRAKEQLAEGRKNAREQAKAEVAAYNEEIRRLLREFGSAWQTAGPNAEKQAAALAQLKQGYIGMQQEMKLTGDQAKSLESRIVALTERMSKMHTATQIADELAKSRDAFMEAYRQEGNAVDALTQKMAFLKETIANLGVAPGSGLHKEAERTSQDLMAAKYRQVEAEHLLRMSAQSTPQGQVGVIRETISALAQLQQEFIGDAAAAAKLDRAMVDLEAQANKMGAAINKSVSADEAKKQVEGFNNELNRLTEEYRLAREAAGTSLSGQRQAVQNFAQGLLQLREQEGLTIQQTSTLTNKLAGLGRELTTLTQNALEQEIRAIKEDFEVKLRANRGETERIRLLAEHKAAILALGEAYGIADKAMLVHLEREAGSLDRMKAGADRSARGDYISAAMGIGMATAPLAAITHQSTEAFAKFDQQMANVNSILKVSDEELQRVTDSVLELSNNAHLAKGPNDLAQGMYQVVSSGFEGKDALDVLTVSAKGATAGLAETGTTTTLLSGILHAFKEQGITAQQAMDILFRTVDKGIITFPQLTQHMGPVIQTASMLGVQLDELGAAIAVLTRKGLMPATAITALNNALLGLANPTREATEEARRMGITWFETGKAADHIKQVGLVNAMREIADATGGATSKVQLLLPGMRELRAAAALAGNGARELVLMQRQFAESAGATDAALEKQSKGFEHHIAKLKAAWERMLIDFGKSNAFLKLTDTLTAAVDYASKIPGKQVIATGAAGVGGVGAALASASMMGFAVQSIKALATEGVIATATYQKFLAALTAVTRFLPHFAIVTAGVTAITGFAYAKDQERLAQFQAELEERKRLTEQQEHQRRVLEQEITALQGLVSEADRQKAKLLEVRDATEKANAESEAAKRLFEQLRDISPAVAAGLNNQALSIDAVAAAALGAIPKINGLIGSLRELAAARINADAAANLIPAQQQRAQAQGAYNTTRNTMVAFRMSQTSIKRGNETLKVVNAADLNEEQTQLLRNVGALYNKDTKQWALPANAMQQLEARMHITQTDLSRARVTEEDATAAHRRVKEEELRRTKGLPPLANATKPDLGSSKNVAKDLEQLLAAYVKDMKEQERKVGGAEMLFNQFTEDVRARYGGFDLAGLEKQFKGTDVIKQINRIRQAFAVAGERTPKRFIAEAKKILNQYGPELKAAGSKNVAARNEAWQRAYGDLEQLAQAYGTTLQQMMISDDVELVPTDVRDFITKSFTKFMPTPETSKLGKTAAQVFAKDATAILEEYKTAYNRLKSRSGNPNADRDMQDAWSRFHSQLEGLAKSRGTTLKELIESGDPAVPNEVRVMLNKAYRALSPTGRARSGGGGGPSHGRLEKDYKAMAQAILSSIQSNTDTTAEEKDQAIQALHDAILKKLPLTDPETGASVAYHLDNGVAALLRQSMNKAILGNRNQEATRVISEFNDQLSMEAEELFLSLKREMTEGEKDERLNKLLDEFLATEWGQKVFASDQAEKLLGATRRRSRVSRVRAEDQAIRSATREAGRFDLQGINDRRLHSRMTRDEAVEDAKIEFDRAEKSSYETRQAALTRFHRAIAAAERVHQKELTEIARDGETQRLQMTMQIQQQIADFTGTVQDRRLAAETNNFVEKRQMALQISALKEQFPTMAKELDAMAANFYRYSDLNLQREQRALSDNPEDILSSLFEDGLKETTTKDKVNVALEGMQDAFSQTFDAISRDNLSMWEKMGAAAEAGSKRIGKMVVDLGFQILKEQLGKKIQGMLMDGLTEGKAPELQNVASDKAGLADLLMKTGIKDLPPELLSALGLKKQTTVVPPDQTVIDALKGSGPGGTADAASMHQLMRQSAVRTEIVPADVASTTGTVTSGAATQAAASGGSGAATGAVAEGAAATAGTAGTAGVAAGTVAVAAVAAIVIAVVLAALATGAIVDRIFTLANFGSEKARKAYDEARKKTVADEMEDGSFDLGFDIGGQRARLNKQQTQSFNSSMSNALVSMIPIIGPVWGAVDSIQKMATGGKGGVQLDILNTMDQQYESFKGQKERLNNVAGFLSEDQLHNKRMGILNEQVAAYTTQLENATVATEPYNRAMQGLAKTTAEVNEELMRHAKALATQQADLSWAGGGPGAADEAELIPLRARKEQIMKRRNKIRWDPLNQGEFDALGEELKDIIAKEGAVAAKRAVAQDNAKLSKANLLFGAGRTSQSDVIGAYGEVAKDQLNRAEQYLAAVQQGGKAYDVFTGVEISAKQAAQQVIELTDRVRRLADSKYLNSLEFARETAKRFYSDVASADTMTGAQMEANKRAQLAIEADYWMKVRQEAAEGKRSMEEGMQAEAKMVETMKEIRASAFAQVRQQLEQERDAAKAWSDANVKRIDAQVKANEVQGKTITASQVSQKADALREGIVAQAKFLKTELTRLNLTADERKRIQAELHRLETDYIYAESNLRQEEAKKWMDQRIKLLEQEKAHIERLRATSEISEDTALQQQFGAGGLVAKQGALGQALITEGERSGNTEIVTKGEQMLAQAATEFWGYKQKYFGTMKEAANREFRRLIEGIDVDTDELNKILSPDNAIAISQSWEIATQPTRTYSELVRAIGGQIDGIGKLAPQTSEALGKMFSTVEAGPMKTFITSLQTVVQQINAARAAAASGGGGGGSNLYTNSSGATVGTYTNSSGGTNTVGTSGAYYTINGAIYAPGSNMHGKPAGSHQYGGLAGGYQYGGVVGGYEMGGIVSPFLSGPPPGSTDTVPAWLTKGEEVLRDDDPRHIRNLAAMSMTISSQVAAMMAAMLPKRSGIGQIVITGNYLHPEMDMDHFAQSLADELTFKGLV